MRNHFELNSHINTIVGNLPVDVNDVTAMLEIVRRQRNLIHDEFDELNAGVKERNISEVRDGIADVIVTVDGMYFRVGLHYPNVGSWFDASMSIEDCLQAIEIDLTLIEEMLAVGVGNSVGYFKHRLKVYCDSILSSCHHISIHYGVNLLADQMAVYASNMTKFDTDIEVARRGVAKYEALGVRTDIFPNTINGLTYYVIKCTADSVGTDGKKYGAGKFLKSVYFKEPVLEPLPADAPIFELLAAA
jgi:hypothetical protein